LENSEIADDCAAFEQSRAAIYFDGKSSRRRHVILEFKHRLEFQESTEAGIGWSYADIRRVDAPSGTLRLGCLTAPALARVEIRNAALAAELRSRCAQLDDNVPGGMALPRSLHGPWRRWLRSSVSLCLVCRSRPIVSQR
jgi:hypothetical protein